MPEPFGRAMKAARERAGLSQRALGERAGVRHATIAAIESGTAPSMDTALGLCRALGIGLLLIDGRDRVLLTGETAST